RSARSTTRGRRARDAASWLALLEHAADLVKVLAREAAVLDQVQQQRLGRAVEDAIHEIAHHPADHLLLRARRLVEIRAVLGRLLEIPLLLEDVHHGHDGGVGDLAPLEQRLVDVADAGGPAGPDYFHDFQLLRGQDRFSRIHTKTLVLTRSRCQELFSA